MHLTVLGEMPVWRPIKSKKIWGKLQGMVSKMKPNKAMKIGFSEYPLLEMILQGKTKSR